VDTIIRMLVWLFSVVAFLFRWLPQRRKDGPVSDYKYPSE